VGRPIGVPPNSCTKPSLPWWRRHGKPPDYRGANGPGKSELGRFDHEPIGKIRNAVVRRKYRSDCRHRRHEGKSAYPQHRGQQPGRSEKDEIDGFIERGDFFGLCRRRTDQQYTYQDFFDHIWAPITFISEFPAIGRRHFIRKRRRPIPVPAHLHENCRVERKLTGVPSIASQGSASEVLLPNFLCALPHRFPQPDCLNLQLE
jgi:hypothetical protein